jgi:hypothetical protein
LKIIQKKINKMANFKYLISLTLIAALYSLVAAAPLQPGTNGTQPITNSTKPSHDSVPMPFGPEPMPFAPEPMFFGPEPMLFGPEPMPFGPEPMPFGPEHFEPQFPGAFMDYPPAVNPMMNGYPMGIFYF